MTKTKQNSPESIPSQDVKNKKSGSLIPAFTVILLSITLILLFYIIAVLVQIETVLETNLKTADNISYVDDDITDEVALGDYFPGCELITENCLDSSCRYYFLCNDKKYAKCEIYDCGEDFGVGTMDEKGKISAGKKIKQDREKIKKAINKCRGSVEILSSECAEENLRIKVKVSTAGDCGIKGFIAGYGGEEKKLFKSAADFSVMEDNSYLVVLNGCEEITKLIAVGEGGVSIK